MSMVTSNQWLPCILCWPKLLSPTELGLEFWRTMQKSCKLIEMAKKQGRMLFLLQVLAVWVCGIPSHLQWISRPGIHSTKGANFAPFSWSCLQNSDYTDESASVRRRGREASWATDRPHLQPRHCFFLWYAGPNHTQTEVRTGLHRPTGVHSPKETQARYCP